jgi:hypothetical protein
MSPQGGMDVVPVRLKNAVLRLLAHSKYRQHYLPAAAQPAGAAGGASSGSASAGGGPGTPPQQPLPAPGSAGTPRYATPPKELHPPSSYGRSTPPPGAAAVAAAPESGVLSNAGSLNGLMVCASAQAALRSRQRESLLASGPLK